jgi:hypothetical protein
MNAHTQCEANTGAANGCVPARSAIPTATYRLQLHAAFTLHDAAALVPYFQLLGISHLYLSPVQTARAGSMHGYDVVDHRAINPELGGEDALRALATVCHSAGLGIILDIVPNHMAVGGADNEMWLDVLEKGPASAYAAVFDVDFEGRGAGTGKLLVPVLGEPYGEALEAGKIELIWDAGLEKLTFAYGRMTTRKLQTVVPLPARPWRDGTRRSGCMNCWRSNISALRGGPQPAMQLTGVASSTSTNWPASEWRTIMSLILHMGSCYACSKRVLSTVFASITSTVSPIPRDILSVFTAPSRCETHGALQAHRRMGPM